MSIPGHELRILEAHVRQIRLNQLEFARLERPLNEYEQRSLDELVENRRLGFPLQYLIGSQEFWGRTFFVTTQVLVPRPETEGLVERCLNSLKNIHRNTLGPNRPARVLELGVGSGCIGITLCLEDSNVRVWGTEASEGACEVALENAQKLRADGFVLIKVSPGKPDLGDYERFADESFDLLVSNPPYLDETDVMGEDVVAHEPHEALFPPALMGMKDPQLFYKFLAPLCQRLLCSGGIAWFEVAHSRAEETQKIFQEKGFLTNLECDLAGHLRYLKVTKGL